MSFVTIDDPHVEPAVVYRPERPVPQLCSVLTILTGPSLTSLLLVFPNLAVIAMGNSGVVQERPGCRTASQVGRLKAACWAR